ncbi:MAG: cell division protein FtsA [Acidobacteriota bacterium]
MAPTPRVLASLDVGNHRVLALIAELDGKEEIVIRGVGLAPSEGLRCGQVVKMQPVVAAIRAAVEEAELMAKVPLERVFASVAGTFISGRTTRAAITLGNREREVTRRDLEQLHDAARRQPLPPGHAVLNVLTHAYTLDDQDGLLDPLDVVGRQLAVDAYVVACQESPVRTLAKAINGAGLEVEGLLFSPIAAGLATLTEDERRLGAIVIDIGHSNTTYAAFANEKVIAAGCFPLGANKINDDLVHRFQTTAVGAERIKRAAGTTLLDDADPDETLTVPTIDGRGNHVISRLEMCKVLRLRMQETLELVAADILRQVPNDISFTGVVIVGGGAHLEGLAMLAEEVFVMRARLGELEGVADATRLLHCSELPSRAPAVAVGLLAYARSAVISSTAPLALQARSRDGLFSRLARKVLGKKEVAYDHV